MDTAKNLGSNILIEVGTEEQQEKPLDDPKNLDYILGEINLFCSKNKFRMPEYVVVQTGTKVMEMSNTGDFPRREEEIIAYIEKHDFKKLKKITDKYGVKIKQHNTDYLSNESLRFLSRIGIDAVNVAPEFGVVETKKFVGLLCEYQMQSELEELQKLCIESGAWRKWMLKDSISTDFDKTLICAHYNYSGSHFLKIKKALEDKMNIEGRSLDGELRNEIKDCILRYVRHLSG